MPQKCRQGPVGGFLRYRFRTSPPRHRPSMETHLQQGFKKIFSKQEIRFRLLCVKLINWFSSSPIQISRKITLLVEKQLKFGTKFDKVIVLHKKLISFLWVAWFLCRGPIKIRTFWVRHDGCLRWLLRKGTRIWFPTLTGFFADELCETDELTRVNEDDLESSRVLAVLVCKLVEQLFHGSALSGFLVDKRQNHSLLVFGVSLQKYHILQKANFFLFYEKIYTIIDPGNFFHDFINTHDSQKMKLFDENQLIFMSLVELNCIILFEKKTVHRNWSTLG